MIIDLRCKNISLVPYAMYENNEYYLKHAILCCGVINQIDWLQSVKQFFINVSYYILVASPTLMALF